MPELMVGDNAPDFTAESTEGQVRLRAYKGKNVVLYFYPRDQTPGCTMESCSLRDGLENIRAYGTEVLGVSTDDLDSHNKFKARFNLNFPLIADPDFSISKAFGVFNEDRKTSRRVTFVIDKNGIIRHIFPKVDVNAHADEIITVLKSMK
jgi:peroxiredoxin Q/BCP